MGKSLVPPLPDLDLGGQGSLIRQEAVALLLTTTPDGLMRFLCYGDMSLMSPETASCLRLAMDNVEERYSMADIAA